jgi:hypothetical protein
LILSLETFQLSTLLGIYLMGSNAKNETVFVVTINGKEKQLLKIVESPKGDIYLLPSRPEFGFDIEKKPITDFEKIEGYGFNGSESVFIESRYSVHPSTFDENYTTIIYHMRNADGKYEKMRTRTSALKKFKAAAFVYFQVFPTMESEKYDFTKKNYKRVISLGQYNPRQFQMRCGIFVTEVGKRIKNSYEGQARIFSLDTLFFTIHILITFATLPASHEGIHSTFQNCDFKNERGEIRTPNSLSDDEVCWAFMIENMNLTEIFLTRIVKYGISKRKADSIRESIEYLKYGVLLARNTENGVKVAWQKSSKIQ